MSNKQNKQDGWIKFTGLRFVSKYTTQEELVGEIRGFFARRNLKFGELDIEFRMTQYPTSFDWQSGKKMGIVGLMIPGTPPTVQVFMGKFSDRWDFFNTIYHELDHVASLLQRKSYGGDHRNRPYQLRRGERKARNTGTRSVVRLAKLTG